MMYVTLFKLFGFKGEGDRISTCDMTYSYGTGLIHMGK